MTLLTSACYPGNTTQVVFSGSKSTEPTSAYHLIWMICCVLISFNTSQSMIPKTTRSSTGSWFFWRKYYFFGAISYSQIQLWCDTNRRNKNNKNSFQVHNKPHISCLIICPTQLFYSFTFHIHVKIYPNIYSVISPFSCCVIAVVSAHW